MSTTKEFTLEAWIRKFKSELNTIRDFTFKTAISDGTFMMLFGDDSVLSKYTAELNEFLTTADLTQREQEFYAYNPRLLAYDIYGEPEFWYLILYANEMVSALDFHPKRVHFYQPGVMTLLNSIRELELSRKNKNDQEMTSLSVNGGSMNADVLTPII